MCVVTVLVLDVPHNAPKVATVVDLQERDNFDLALRATSLRLRLLGLLLLLARRHRANILVGARTVRSQVSVVDSWMKRNRSGGSHVLEGVLENKLLEFFAAPFRLIEDHLVMDWTSGTLDGNVRAKIKVKLKRMSNSRLYKCARPRVAVPVSSTLSREEANMVALAGNDNRELGNGLATNLAEALLHCHNLLGKDCVILSLRNSITNIEDTLRWLALSDSAHPLLDHIAHMVVDVVLGQHLDAATIRVTLGHVPRIIHICGYSNGCERSRTVGACTRSRVRDISSNNHSWCHLGLLGSKLWNCQRPSPASGAAEFGIDFHGDVREVLALCSGCMTRLNDLRGNSVSTIARLLDATVDIDIAIIDDEKQKSRTSVEMVAGGVPDVRNHLASAGKITLHDGRALAIRRKFTAMGLEGLDELLHEMLSLFLLDRPTSSNDTDTPLTEHHRSRSYELLAIKTPAALNQIPLLNSRVTTEGQLWLRKFASLNSGGLSRNLNPIMLKIPILSPIEHLDALLNCSPALLRKSHGKFDHVGSLTVAELRVVTLVVLDLQHIERQMNGLASNLFGHPSNWNVAINAHTILALEVVEEGNLGAILRLLILVVRIREGILLSILSNEFVNDPGIWSNSLVIPIVGHGEALETSKVLPQNGLLPVALLGAHEHSLKVRNILHLENLEDSTTKCLRTPESSVGNINIDRERLLEVLTKTRSKGRKATLESLNSLTKIKAILATIKERLLDLNILLSRTFTENVIEEIHGVNAARRPLGLAIQEQAQMMKVHRGSVTNKDLMDVLVGRIRSRWTALLRIKVDSNAQIIFLELLARPVTMLALVPGYIKIGILTKPICCHHRSRDSALLQGRS